MCDFIILYNTKFTQIIRSGACVLFLVLAGFIATAQRSDDGSMKSEATYITMAWAMAKYGYVNQKPEFLITAAQTLIDHPVKGAFVPLTIKLKGNTDSTAAMKYKKRIVIDPVLLISDAETMAGGDSVLLAMASRVSKQMKDGTPRGRKYSPYVQEYLLNSNATVELNAEFVGEELAEVYVVPYNDALIDLVLIDQRGRIVVADKNKTQNCYVTFTPPNTAVYKIQVRNRGDQNNEILLMTN